MTWTQSFMAAVVAGLVAGGVISVVDRFFPAEVPCPCEKEAPAA